MRGLHMKKDNKDKVLERINSLISAGDKIPTFGRNTVDLDKLEMWETECEIFLFNLLGEEHLITQKFKAMLMANAPYKSAVEIGQQILKSIKSDLELEILSIKGKLSSVERIPDELLDKLPKRTKNTAETVNQLIDDGISEALPPMLRKLIHNFLIYGLNQLKLPSEEIKKCKEDPKRAINLCIQLDLISSHIGSGLKNVKALGDDLAHSPYGTAFIQLITEDIRIITIAFGEFIPRLGELLQNSQDLESKVRKIPQLKVTEKSASGKSMGNKVGFELGGIGNRATHYYYMTIKNNSGATALNCRARLKIGAHDADTVWSDPSHPREIDIPLKEELDLFCIIRDAILIPSGAINPLTERQILRQTTWLKAESLANAWQEGAHINKYNLDDLKKQSLTITITARNATPLIVKLKSIEDIINALEKKDFITQPELDKLNLLVTE